MNIILCVVSDYAVFDQANKPSIIGIYDFVSVKNLPSMFPQTYLTTIFLGKPDTKKKVDFSLISPSKKEVLTNSLTVNFSKGGRFSHIAKLEQVPIEELGKYTFTWKDKETVLAEYVVDVITAQ